MCHYGPGREQLDLTFGGAQFKVRTGPSRVKVGWINRTTVRGERQTVDKVLEKGRQRGWFEMMSRGKGGRWILG